MMKFQEKVYILSSFLFRAIALEDGDATSTFRRQLQGVAAEGFAMCDGCWCIKDSGESCLEPVPPQDYTDLLPALRRLELTNPFSLCCDPYVVTDCDTIPPLEADGGACIVNTDCLASSYALETYSGTAQEALDEGLIVTHEGPCATCSTLQDLAVYMEQGPALRTEAQECGFAAVFNETKGYECFLNLGMTDACAWTWLYNADNTRKHCGLLCTEFVLNGDPSNGPPPNCTLAECLQCDEDNSGPIFKEFSGRTRRNSYLWSNIGRPCSVYGVALNHTDPCSAGVMSGQMGVSWSLPSLLRDMFAVAILGL